MKAGEVALELRRIQWDFRFSEDTRLQELVQGFSTAARQAFGRRETPIDPNEHLPTPVADAYRAVWTRYRALTQGEPTRINPAVFATKGELTAAAQTLKNVFVYRPIGA